MMKKIGFGLVGLVVLICFIYAAWIQFPRIQDPARLAAIESTATANFQRVQAEAKDPERNGFLSPTFLPYWGRKGREGTVDSPIEKTVTTWRDHSFSDKGKRVEHSALASDLGYLSARVEFEKVAPELTLAMQRPIFAAPDETWDFNTVFMNFIAVRSSAQAVIGLAESKAAEGQMERAADLAVTVMELGKALETQTTMLSEMIGTAVQAIGFDGYVGLIGPESNLSGGQWKALAGRLTAAIPAQDQLAMAMDSELMGFKNSMALVRKGKHLQGVDPSSLGPFRLPGMLAREERIYSNLIVLIDTDLRTQNVVRIPSFIDSPSTSDYMTGRTGVMAMILLPNYARGHGQTKFQRAKMAGAALATGLLAYRAQKGELPKKIDELASAGIAMPETSDIQTLGVRYVKTGQTGTLIIPFDGKSVGNPSSDDLVYGQRTWYDVGNGVITFRV